MSARGFPLAWAQLAPSAADHLWQSTLFAGVIMLLTLGFRRNTARLRYGLWFAASAKFLVPLAFLISLGTHLGNHRAPAGDARQTIYLVLSQPFSSTGSAHVSRSGPLLLIWTVLIVWLVGTAASLGFWTVRVWAIRTAVRQAIPASQGRELAVLRRMERPCGIGKPVELRVSPPGAQVLEPGIFGIRKPVLLWPAALTAHLDDRQLDAIVAHELAHVRRRDNLLAAIHMVVQALFWFHPLIWWIGRRLLVERERACDEAALLLASSPYTYAEAILSVCRFYAEPSPACFSSITGRNLSHLNQLNQRITRIMTHPNSHALTRGRKALLATLATAVIAGPLAFGLWTAPQLRAQAAPDSGTSLPSFTDITIVPNISEGQLILIPLAAKGTFDMTNVSVLDMIRFAYGVNEYQVTGGPSWIGSARYDVHAVMPDSGQKRELMMQSLLATRFQLSAMQATKVMPIYSLVSIDDGKELSPLLQLPSNAVDPVSGEKIITVRVMVKDGKIITEGPLGGLAEALSRQLGADVADRTGLPGNYNLMLQLPMQEQVHGEAPSTSLLAALRNQLGLELQPRSGPITTLAIDRVEKPSPN